jgi:uncharacterized protein YcbX
MFVNEAETNTGKVVSIWRYPVKSMLGEELNSCYVTERGLMGDRVYAVIDEQTGKVVSAKNPNKWGKHFDFRSTFIDQPQSVDNIPPVRITFPDGSQIFSNQNEEMNHILSKVLGREVKLIRNSLDKPIYEEYWPNIEGLAQREKTTDEAMPPQSFFDIAVVHILTTSTINRLRELYPKGRFEIRRFRPNIVVESLSAQTDFVENLWVGKNITIGEEIMLKVIQPCTRCVMITLPQSDLPKDLGILQTVAKYNQVNVGVYASVHRGGTIRRGDSVQIKE